MPKTKILISIVLAFLLTACGGSPNSTDLQHAVTMQMTALIGVEGVASRQKIIDSLKIIDCKQADKGGYQCDWNSDQGAGSGRLVKSDRGWVRVE